MRAGGSPRRRFQQWVMECPALMVSLVGKLSGRGAGYSRYASVRLPRLLQAVRAGSIPATINQNLGRRPIRIEADAAGRKNGLGLSRSAYSAADAASRHEFHDTGSPIKRTLI